MGKNKTNKRIKGKTNPKKKKVWKKVLLILFLLLLIGGGIFAYRVYKNGWGLSGMLATVAGHDENTKKNLTEFKCLILGISTDQENVELTDTIMVASYNPNTQKATLLSIPRDTYTGSNPKKATAYEKINALYSRKHRPDETLEAVNEITGLNIEYYVVVKTEALIELVDAIGGVTFNVPIDMDYDDETQDLHIHLEAGEQLLDGDKAEQLLRFRHNNDGTTYPEEYGNNDIGRMRTQREFILQAVNQTAKVENIFKLGEILDIAKENVITNIDFNVAKDYIPYVVEFNTENLITAALPGTTPDWDTTNGVSIFVYDEEETAELIQEIFYDRDIQETTQGTEETDTTNNTTNSTTSTTSSKSNIKIEVLNGSGTGSNLQDVVSELETAGYNVTRTGSTNTTTKTTIINKKDVSDTLIQQIQNIVGSSTVQNSTSSSSKVDLTVIIGTDY